MHTPQYGQSPQVGACHTTVKALRHACSNMRGEGREGATGEGVGKGTGECTGEGKQG